MEFNELAALRKLLIGISARHTTSLQAFYDPTTTGFKHRFDAEKNGISIASTSTAISSLVAAGKWDAPDAVVWSERTRDTIDRILHAEWTSTGLPERNVFSTSFVLEAVDALRSFVPDTGSIPNYDELVAEAESIIRANLANGCARLESYPASAYLTQLAFRVLRARDGLKPDAVSTIREWAIQEVYRQLALFDAQSKTADVYQLVYAIMLVQSAGERATPDEALVLQVGLDRVFERQLPDGSWPRSQPLFHYPTVGNAYCFEYEMLTQLLLLPERHLLTHLPRLRDSAFALNRTRQELPGGGVGWASGHHPQFKGPESWSTASVYHFVHVLDRLLAEAVRQALFEHVDNPYTPPSSPKTKAEAFAPNFLDCELRTQGSATSLKQTILHKFVLPIANEDAAVKAGRSMSETTPMSAIFFGPPGTSKTELSRLIAEFLGWPLLTVDPSHFVRGGFDKVQAEADQLFSMLAVAERVVVLLDEFDEMVRDRGQAAEVLSRFLTTGMLPKLAAINKHRRIVFIVATNYIGRFDTAISRHGRFDIIVQVLPPSTEQKFKKWPEFLEHLKEHKVAVDQSLKDKLADLTFDEFKRLVPRVIAAKSKTAVNDLLNHAHESCTLNGLPSFEPADSQSEVKAESEKRSWKTMSADEVSRVRYE